MKEYLRSNGQRRLAPPRPRASAPKGAMGVALASATLALAATASADPTPRDNSQFRIDAVSDGVLTGAGAGFSVLLELVLSTGEIRPYPAAPGDGSNLLGIDRIALTQTVDRNAATFSDVGRGLAIAYAALDPVMSGVRDGWDSALVDAVMYAESISMTVTLTDVTKIAVRRPRPSDYINPDNAKTDSALSFFSGHSAVTAGIGATATYLAFVRSPRSPRPWITLAASVLLAGFVSYERVRAGAHFPTDVIAGSMAGAAIGVLVPHLHRAHVENSCVWIGLAPSMEGTGGSLTLQGIF